MTIGWSDTKQTIDGFGASSAFFGETITDAVADQLFDAKKGIGLSLLRTMIGLPDDTQDDGSEPVDGAMPIATSPGLITALQATLRGTKVWATAWTPPPIWKTTNNKNGSGTDYNIQQARPRALPGLRELPGGLRRPDGQEQHPAHRRLAANEPDYTASWDGAQWTPDELTTFIGQNLGPTFAQRFPSVKIIAPDTASWPNVDRYLKPMLADPAAKDYLSVVATHPYSEGSGGVGLDYRKPAENGKQFWQTEWSQENPKGDTPNPTMTSAIDMMKRLHDHMVVSNMNAWNWWAIYISADALESADTPKIRENPALIQPDASLGEAYMFKRGYALGNWSKFVRPGFQRIAATDRPTGGVLIEAYRDATHLAVIAVNTGSKPVTQKFILDGATFGTLTPWVTSPDDNLAAKDPFTAYDTFTYDLPASSVVTFVNWDATTRDAGPGHAARRRRRRDRRQDLYRARLSQRAGPEQRRERGRHGLHRLEGRIGSMGRSAGAVGKHLRVQGSGRFDDERRGGEPDVARDGRRHGERLRRAPASASRFARRSRRSRTSSSRCPGPHPDATWSCRSRRSISSPSSKRRRAAATRTSRAVTTSRSKGRSRCPRRSRR